MGLGGEESGLGRRGGKHLKYSKKGKLNIRLFQLPFCCQRAVMNDEFFIPFWPSALRYRHLRERD